MADSPGSQGTPNPTVPDPAWSWSLPSTAVPPSSPPRPAALSPAGSGQCVASTPDGEWGSSHEVTSSDLPDWLFYGDPRVRMKGARRHQNGPW
jgi:hypothetical protein